MVNEHKVAHHDCTSPLYPRQEEPNGAVEAIEDVAADIEYLIVERVAFDTLLMVCITTYTSSSRKPVHRSSPTKPQNR